MKQMMGLVIFAGFLVTTADLEAADGWLVRSGTKDGATPQLVSAGGPQLLAVTDYAPPPPAPAVDAAPPGAMPPTAGPLLAGPPVMVPVPQSAQPLPEAGPPGLAGPAAGGAPVAIVPAAALYPNVRYKDRRHIAPCAVPLVVAVRDPCERHDRCSCGPPKCVMVEICVPPCGTPRITSKHDGTKVRYDYGKYAVNITSRHGVVVVNYDR